MGGTALSVCSSLLVLLVGLSVSAGEPADDQVKQGQVGVTVVLKDPGKKLQIDSPTKIVATPFDTTANGRPPGAVVLQSSPAAEGLVSLPYGRWVFEAETEIYWSSRAQITVGAEPQTAVVELWPAGLISGSIGIPRGEPQPTELFVAFQETPGLLERKGIPATTVPCTLAETDWVCKLPAGTLDLRMWTGGFIPRYQWGVPVKANRTLKLGRFELVRGSAVVGWVTTVDGTSPANGKVTLRPRSAPIPNSGEQTRIRTTRSFSAGINDRGFFQINAVPPGAYMLEATLSGFAPAITTVRVTAGEVTQIADPPLHFNYPETLEIFVTPSHDPWARRWLVALARQRDIASPLVDPVLERRTEDDGTLTLTDLEPGLYRVKVQGGDGDTWWTQKVQVEGNMLPLYVDLPVIDVEGTVALGDVPLAAKIWFGGRWGAVRIELESNEDGEFSGTLPHPGEWIVGINAEDPPVERELRGIAVEPKPGRRLAEVDLKLPDTLLAGKVVNEAGEPQARALVNVNNLDVVGEAPQTFTNDKGRFEYHGLLPGTTAITASGGRDFASDTITVQVTDGGQIKNLKLVLRQSRWLRGYVVSAVGAVPGAEVRAKPLGVVDLGTPPGVTNARGEFRIKLAPEAREAVLRVSAPGFAFRLMRVRIPKNEDPVVVRVEETGGTLIVESDGPFGSNDADRGHPVIVRGDSFASMFAFRSWADFSGGGWEAPDRLVVPQVEPGSYSLCLATAAEYSALSAGLALPLRCDPGGYLPPNGELTLRIPSGEAD